MGTGSLLGWGHLPRAEDAPGLSVLAGILSWAQNPEAPLAISSVLRREAQHHGTSRSNRRPHPLRPELREGAWEG